MICNICEKESVCKLIDGSDVVKCAEFLGIKETDYKMTMDETQGSGLGDYPDAIHNQFDNMTGSMNL